MMPLHPRPFARPWGRRDLLRAAVAAAAGSRLLPAFARAAGGPATRPGEPEGADKPRLSNGGDEPFPIPWLDKNGNHNQPAGPDAEPSHVYHFKGKVARCAGFVGAGTDGQGNRLGFGTKTTDFGFMDGEYFAARAPHRAALTHI